jgi:long-chain acyl-CoA synthetase
VRHQQSWLDSFAVSRQEFGIQAGDRLLIPGSLAYSLSLFTALDGLQAGATVYLSAPFNPRRAVAQLEQADLTWIVGVPTMVSAIAQVAHRRQCAWPSVRGVICSGSSSPATLWEQVTPVVPNATHYAYYGASELSFVSLWTSQDYPPPASIGRAMAGVRVAILAPDGTPCPPGEVGEIAVQSSMVSLGYLTVGLRWVKGWATVGDRGWMDDQGWIYLAGRPSDRLTTGGLTLYPYPLERALEHRPEIRQAAVIGLPDPQRGDRIVAVVEWQPGACLSRRQLRQWLLTQVPRPHCPQQFYCTPTWPLAPSGKLDRHQLQQWVVANQLDRIG